MLSKLLKSVSILGKSTKTQTQSENNENSSINNTSSTSSKNLNMQQNNQNTNSSSFNLSNNSPDIPEYRLGKTENFHYNFCWLLGRRQTQEDAHMAESLGKGCFIFGIFDGHGNSVVSNKVAHILPKLMKEEIKKIDTDEIAESVWTEIINTVFQKIDKIQKVLKKLIG